MTSSSASDHDLYTFDSRGYVKRSAFLDDTAIAKARAHVHELSFTRDSWHEDQLRTPDIHKSTRFFAELGRRLFDDPLTGALISYPHRILESYALIRKSGQLDLHGGVSELLANSTARDHSARSSVVAGQIYSLRVKILLYLDDVTTPEDGRLTYVEGSHKSGYPFHRIFPGGRSEAGDLLRSVSVSAGDAIWLNEGLLHGAEPKSSPAHRRLLAYTFGPSFMTTWQSLDGDAMDRSGYADTLTENMRDHGK